MQQKTTLLRCCKVRSCARAIKLVAKINKSMTRLQVTVGELEHHDSYCCCWWDWHGATVIQVAKSIGLLPFPVRVGWCCCSTVSASRLATAMSARMRRTWHRNSARSSSSVGNAPCVFKAELNVFDLPQLKQDLSSQRWQHLFWSFAWNQISAFWNILESAICRWCRDGEFEVWKGEHPLHLWDSG